MTGGIGVDLVFGGVTTAASRLCCVYSVIPRDGQKWANYFCNDLDGASERREITASRALLRYPKPDKFKSDHRIRV